MFDRSRSDSPPEQAGVTVEIVLTTARRIKGKLILPIGKAPTDALNGPGGFLEVLPFGAERLFIAKGSIQSIKIVTMPATGQLAERIRDLDGFDPHTVLGVTLATPWEETRQAYLVLAKIYHPDRFETLELPTEVKGYLANMSRRINAAFEALEDARAPVVRRGDRVKPIYESRARS